MSTSFDFKRLAEAEEVEQQCQDCMGSGAVYKLRDHEGNPVQGALVSSRCDSCAGTGHVVLFPSLRVQQHKSHNLNCLPGCPGWSPEPDPRVACWEIIKVIGIGRVHTATIESVIRAALAWLEDRGGG